MRDRLGGHVTDRPPGQAHRPSGRVATVGAAWSLRLLACKQYSDALFLLSIVLSPHDLRLWPRKVDRHVAYTAKAEEPVVFVSPGKPVAPAGRSGHRTAHMRAGRAVAGSGRAGPAAGRFCRLPHDRHADSVRSPARLPTPNVDAGSPATACRQSHRELHNHLAVRLFLLSHLRGHSRRRRSPHYAPGPSRLMDIQTSARPQVAPDLPPRALPRALS
jgi:hypothetical protein